VVVILILVGAAAKRVEIEHIRIEHVQIDDYILSLVVAMIK